MSALVMPEDLLAAGVEGVTLLDVRWQLGRSDGREQFEAGHLPGAAYVDLERDLAAPVTGPVGPAGRHPLPDPERFAAAMRRCGVSRDRPVVVYDDVSATSAARAWWLLRHHGHPDIRVLDGGFGWWRRLGGPVEAGPASPVPGDFVSDLAGDPAGHRGSGPDRLPVLDADGAQAVAASGALLDARAAERFRGEVEPVDPVAGHIPGAVSVPTAQVLVADGPRAGRFKAPDELAAVLHTALAPGTAVAATCGSGVTAAHLVLALDLLGVRAGLYAGSWSGWVSDPARPVETG